MLSTCHMHQHLWVRLMLASIHVSVMGSEGDHCFCLTVFQVEDQQ